MSKKPIFLLDLHGMTKEEAKAEVRAAFRRFENAKNAAITQNSKPKTNT